jgi:hypothetical protein
MPALVAGIHVLLFSDVANTWMAETSPAMTVGWVIANVRRYEITLRFNPA